MTVDIGLFSYLMALLAFTALSLLMTISWRGRPFGGVLITASALTALWAAVIVAGTQMAYPPVKLIQFTEVLRNAGWIYLLAKLASSRFHAQENVLGGWHWVPVFGATLAGVLAALLLLPLASAQLPFHEDFYSDITYAIWLGIALVGLLLLEQLFRNATAAQRWSIKYLCLALGAIFAYDFFMYAEALLFKQLSPQLWQARGLVNALAVPLLAVSIARNADWKLQLHVSRQVVFHSVTLLGAGLYLMTMALAGYFIKYLGGSWGGVLQISFLMSAGALLIALLFSGRIRAHTRVWLSKHFFSYKYDYREQWQNFTRALATIGDDVPEGIVRAIAPLANSSAGLLWARNEAGQFALLSFCEMPEPGIHPKLEKLAQWLEDTQWVIDIDELHNSPDIYQNLEYPESLEAIAEAWLIIPLMFGEKLQGIVLLKRSELQKSLNWEDRDLLKTAGRQAASHLAQYQSKNALVEARQFDAFNRLSAYVVHDLKNILAQQSLMVSNAEKHKHNPEFIDDMIATVNNSVTRMTNLMEQMRSGLRGADPSAVVIATLLNEVVSARGQQEPAPTLTIESNGLETQCNREQLYTVFNHLIQNAQEATGRTGAVEVCLRRDADTAIIEIKDNGEGMTPEFIKNRLFKAFDSTKGLTGMGIGAFESREFIRSLGGDIKVESQPTEGSLFRVFIPCLQEA